jgi:thrombospondin type 3 repeat protein
MTAMTTKSTLLSIGMLTAVALAIPYAADLRPAVVANLTGAMRIQQPIPCGGTIDTSTPVTAGRLEFTPAEGFDAGGGARSFTLTRATVTFAGFTARGSCLAFDVTKTYGEIGVHITKTVSFVAYPTGLPDVYRATIPKDGIVFAYSTTIDGAPDRGLKVPSQDPIVTIDFAAARMTMHVVFGIRGTFREGCISERCVIDETHTGSITVDLAGSIAFPDADGDGVPDRSDNCRLTANPTQQPVATPTIQPPPDLTVGSCLPRNFGFARGVDVCDGTRVTVSNDAPRLFVPGPNTIDWRAEDGLHRVATATQIVTVIDRTPPTVSCTPVRSPGSSFYVSASDECGGHPVIKLGSYALADGEVIQITETGQPGVRLQNVVGADRIRHFLVGRGQAIVTATDESRNVGSAMCSVQR